MILNGFGGLRVALGLGGFQQILDREQCAGTYVYLLFAQTGLTGKRLHIQKRF